MFVLRGLNGRELVRENFDQLQHDAYVGLPPQRMERCDGYFTLIAYIPGGYVKCEAVMHRGSNALAMPKEFCDKVWGKENK